MSEQELSDVEIDQIVHTYQRERHRFDAAMRIVAANLSDLLDAQGTKHLIAARTKNPKNLAEKLGLKRVQYGAKRGTLSSRIDLVLNDLAACRVLLYRPEERPFVVALVKQEFKLATDLADHDKNKDTDAGYRAHHFLIVIEEEGTQTGVPLSETICELQITTVAAHLFNEVEHDIKYKQHGITPSEAIKSSIATLRDLSTAVETAVDGILAEHDRTVATQRDPIATVNDLRSLLFSKTKRLLSGNFPDLLEVLQLVELLSDSSISEMVNAVSVGDPCPFQEVHEFAEAFARLIKEGKFGSDQGKHLEQLAKIDNSESNPILQVMLRVLNASGTGVNP